MLPKNYYGMKPEQKHGDGDWLAERIGLVPIAMQLEISDRYNFIFLKLKMKKEKQYRRRANLWLLRTTKKYQCKYTGKELF